MRGGPSRVVAGCFGLTAFVVAIVAGLAAHNPTLTILGRALIAMILCYPLGLVVGMLCQRVVRMHEEQVASAGELSDPAEVTDEKDAGEAQEPAAGDREALAV